MKLYILRHGETAWNKEKRLQGQTDIPLAQNGIDLAKKVGQGMKDISIDLVISSPLKRAVETASLVMDGRNVPITTDPRIQEICFGDWEGNQVTEATSDMAKYMEDFFTLPLNCPRPPHGETFQDVCKRTKDFLQDLIGNPDYSDSNILVSTHGAAGRCLLHALDEDSEDLWRGCVPPNCSVSIVAVKDGSCTLVAQDVLYA